MKRPAFVVGFSLLISLFVISNIYSTLLAILMIAFCIFSISLFVIFLREEKFFPYLLGIFISILLGVILYTAFESYYYLNDIKNDGKELIVYANVAETPSKYSEGYSYILKPIKAEFNGQSIELRGKILGFYKGEKKLNIFESAKFRLKLSVPQRSDIFDIATNQKAKGIFTTANIKEISEIKTKSNAFNPMYYAVAVRDYFAKCCESFIGGNEGLLIKSVVIGNKEGLDEKIYSDFKISGISHTMAVSGMNLVFFLGFMVSLLELLRVNRRITYTLCIIFTLFLAAVCGFSSSVSRSVLMLLILYLGLLLSKEGDGLNSLGFSVLLLLLVNPFSVKDLSLLLSVFATMGILVLVKPITAFLKSLFKTEKPNVLISTLYEAFSCSIAATLFTMPLLVFAFKHFSVFTLFTNLLAVFPVLLGFVLGALVCAFSFFSPISYFLGFICRLIALYLIKLTSFISSFTYSYVFLDRFYIYLFSIFLIFFSLWRFFKMKTKFKILTVILAALAFLFVCFAVDLVFFQKKNSSLKIEVINVGQGDSIALIKNGEAVLVDAGGTDNPLSKIESTLNKDGIVNLKTVILTHYHDDHDECIDDIIEKNRPQNVILPPSFIDGKSKDKILKACQKSGSSATYADMDLQSDALKDVKIEVLTKHIDRENKKEPNDNSLVIKVTQKDESSLLMGDLDDANWRLIKCYGSYLDTDFLKVAHHGSKNAVSDELLKLVTPKFAAISLSKENRYNMPDESTLSLLEKYNVKTFRTDTNGNIEFFNNIVIPERQAS